MVRTVLIDRACPARDAQVSRLFYSARLDAVNISLPTPVDAHTPSW